MSKHKRCGTTRTFLLPYFLPSVATERGSTVMTADRLIAIIYNYRSPRISPNSNWRKHNEKLLLHPPVILSDAQRKSVERSIRDTCEKRGWTLLAINVRTNHVHVVVRIGAKKPKDALIALKANATRQLREDKLWNNGHTPWADKGSKRNLWNQKSLAAACNYVINEQGDDLPDFDSW